MNKRSHKQNCSLAYAADILSERWTLLIVRELLLKPCRYGELLNNMPGMGTNLLANRLKELSELELIEKQQSRYQLTALGQSLEPTILGLIRWGFQLSKELSDPSYLHRPEWDLLALKALFNPESENSESVSIKISSNDGKTKSRDQESSFSCWISIKNNQFEFGFEPMPTAPDINWDYPIADLAIPAPERLLKNKKQKDALNLFLSYFNKPNQ